jgi:hypothetical protein
MRHRCTFTWLLLLLIIGLFPKSGRGETVYVADTGNDTTADGSQGRPFKTLAMACEKTAAGNKTIQIAEGIFNETRPCRPAAGVSIAGAGVDKTTLHWAVTEDLGRNPWKIAPDSFLIQVHDSNNASLGGFTIDGLVDDQTRAHGGILARRVRHLSIHDIRATSFNMCAIYLSEAADSEIHDCRVDDSGHPDKQSCTGAIMVGELTDSSVYNCVIRERLGAYGVKGWRYSWGDKSPSGDPNLRMPLTRCSFHGNDIKVRQQGGWGNGQPNMAMELWNARPTDCQIYDNRFNECLSLTGGGKGPKTYRVHHNKFVEESGYSYAMEIAVDDVEVDHNYFTNGDYPLAGFGGRVSGLNVHDNVFDHIESVAILNFAGGLHGFRFEHNTVNLKQSLPVLALGGGSDDLKISGNLFCKEGPAASADFVSYKAGDPAKGPATVRAGTLDISGNQFVNWPPSGEKAVSSDKPPVFKAKGDRESVKYFELAGKPSPPEAGVRPEAEQSRPKEP